MNSHEAIGIELLEDAATSNDVTAAITSLR
jgi:hypothetical protein